MTTSSSNMHKEVLLVDRSQSSKTTRWNRCHKQESYISHNIDPLLRKENGWINWVRLYPLAHAQFASLNSAQSKKRVRQIKNCEFRLTSPALLSDKGCVAGRSRQRYNVEICKKFLKTHQPATYNSTTKVCELLKLCMLFDGSVYTLRALKGFKVQPRFLQFSPALRE